MSLSFDRRRLQAVAQPTSGCSHEDDGYGPVDDGLEHYEVVHPGENVIGHREVAPNAVSRLVK